MASLTFEQGSNVVTCHLSVHAGRAIFVREPKGWYDLPDSKGQSEPNPQGPGNFDGADDWPSAAVYSFTGYIRGDDRADAFTLQQQLKSIRSVQDLTKITLDDGVLATHRFGSIRRIKFGDIRNGRRVDFAIDVQSDDPFRYGEEIVTQTGLPSSSGGIVWPIVYPIDWGSGGDPGRLVMSNPGDEATAAIVVTATGELTGGFSILNIEDGLEIRVERIIPAGQTAYIDFSTGAVYLDSEANDLGGFITRAEWWTIPAGESRTIQFSAISGSNGTPLLTARTKPAYR